MKRKPSLTTAPRKFSRLWPMAEAVWDHYRLSPAARQSAALSCVRSPDRALICYAAILRSL